MVFSPRGTAFVVSRDFDKLTVLDPRKSEMKVMTKPNFDRQWPLKISCDGALLATEGHDGLLFVWDLASVRAKFGDLGIDWKNLDRIAVPTLPDVEVVDQPREKSDNR